MSGLIEEMRALGVNVDEAIMRMNNNSALYEKMLVKFVKLMKDSTPALDSDSIQCDEMIEVTHAIKGASGNLSIVPIYTAYSEVVRLLRAGQEQEARELLEKTKPIQEEIIACIEKYA